MKKINAIAWLITMMVTLVASPACATDWGPENVTMQVGETQTLYLPSSVAGKRLKSVSFYSNGISYVQVLSYTNSSVKVKAIKAFSSPIIVRCDYYYYVTSGSYTYQAKGAYDYKITVIGEIKVKPTKITLPSVVSLEVGETKDLIPTITPSNAEYTLTWRITNSSIAAVYQNGMITGKSVGETDLKVSADNGVYTMCRIVVYKPSASSVSIASSLALNVGEATTLTPMVYPSNADYSLSWSSSRPDVATVSSSGLVIAMSPGTTRITVQTNNGRSASCMLTVIQPLDDLTFSLGESGGESYKAYVTNYAADFSGSDNVQAYIVIQTTEDRVVLEEVEKAPKGTPLLLKGVQGERVTIQLADYVFWDKENLLQKATSSKSVTRDDNIYVPAFHESKWGFYRFEGTLPSMKVYLDLKTMLVKANMMDFWSEQTTGISMNHDVLGADEHDRHVYDFSGKAISQKQKHGLYIINGRKVFVK